MWSGLFGPTRFDLSDADYDPKEDCREWGPVERLPLCHERQENGTWGNRPWQQNRLAVAAVA